jgi:hypothetical protein
VFALGKDDWQSLYEQTEQDVVLQLKQRVKQLQDKHRSAAARKRHRHASKVVDSQLEAAVKSMKRVWPKLPQSKRDWLGDLLHNEGRSGKARCGRRWLRKASRSFARRLAQHTSGTFLHWVDQNVAALPTKADTYRKDVAVVLSGWGLQEHQLRACALGSFGDSMRDSDLTFSVDEMAIDPVVSHVKVSKLGEPLAYRLDGFANCVDTLKYGPAKTVIVHSYEEIAATRKEPKANQVGDHIHLTYVSVVCLLPCLLMSTIACVSVVFCSALLSSIGPAGSANSLPCTLTQ